MNNNAKITWLFGAMATLAVFFLVVKTNVIAASFNLILNPSVETTKAGLPQYWLKDKWGQNSPTFTYASNGQDGKKSLLVKMANYRTGDAKWYFSPVAVLPNTSYTFTDYYKSTVDTFIVAEFTNIDGTVDRPTVLTVPKSLNWQLANVTVTTPVTAKKLTFLHVINKNGTLQTDNFSLSQVFVAPTPVATSVPVGGGSSSSGGSSGSSGSNQTPYPTPINTAAATETPTPVISPTATPTLSPTDSPTPTPTLSPTPTSSASSTESATPSPTPTASPTLSATPTASPTASPTSTPSMSPTATPSVTPTSTPSASPMSTPNPTPILDGSIPNNSVETVSDTDPTLPASWHKGGFGTNSAVFSYLNNLGHTGSHAIRIDVSAYTDGDAKWYYDAQNVTAGQKVTFIDYYQSNVATRVIAEIINTDQTKSYIELKQAPAAADFTQYADSFTPPQTASTVTVFHVLSQVGFLTTDDYQLVPYLVPLVVITDNVPNNSVEQLSDANPTLPAGWLTGQWGVNTTAFSYLSDQGHTGTHAVKTEITSYTTGDAKWYYQPMPTTGGNVFRFTDYYQANIASRVTVETTNSDGTHTYIELSPAPATTGWDSYTDTFTTPANAVSLTVFHLIAGVGYLITDDYAVTPYEHQGFSRPLVTLTFDDGYLTEFTNAKPVLDSYGFKSTYYIATGLLNTSNYMSDAMVQALKDAGNQIADHTATHPHLPLLADTVVDNELKISQLYLQQHFGVTANDFASPYGEMNDAVLAHVKAYFRSHRSVTSGYNFKDNFDSYNLQVQNVLLTTTPEEVQGWLDEAKRTNTYLILVFHDIDDTGDPYGTTLTKFSAEMQKVSESTLPVVTLDQAMTEISPQLGN